jgi:hypothetical protein
MGMQPTKRSTIHVTVSIGTERHLCQLYRVSCTYNKNIKASKPEEILFRGHVNLKDEETKRTSLNTP